MNFDKLRILLFVVEVNYSVRQVSLELITFRFVHGLRFEYPYLRVEKVDGPLPSFLRSFSNKIRMKANLNNGSIADNFD